MSDRTPTELEPLDAPSQEALRAWARQTGAQPDAMQRLAARMRAPRPRPAPRWITGVAAGLAAAAALAFSLWPDPALDPVLPATGARALGSFVSVTLDGQGSARGTRRDLTVDWHQGRIAVEVEPDQGVSLRVLTEEAAVRVVGTGFSVHRSALGTEVSVRHGRVAVDCVDGPSASLGAEEAITCLPVTAAGALGRARALEGTVSAAALLVELDRALSRPDVAGAVASELQAMRTSALLREDRSDEALQAAEAALKMGAPTRALELHRVAARLRLRNNDCSGALAHLLALRDADALGEDAPWLPVCLSEVDP
jgi:hypothetical protein